MGKLNNCCTIYNFQLLICLPVTAIKMGKNQVSLIKSTFFGNQPDCVLLVFDSNQPKQRRMPQMAGSIVEPRSPQNQTCMKHKGFRFGIFSFENFLEDIFNVLKLCVLQFSVFSEQCAVCIHYRIFFQDNSDVIENEELSGFLKDLLELVKKVIRHYKTAPWLLTAKPPQVPESSYYLPFVYMTPALYCRTTTPRTWLTLPRRS